MSVVTKGDYSGRTSGGMTGRPMGSPVPYSSGSIGGLYGSVSGGSRAGYVSAKGGSRGTARTQYGAPDPFARPEQPTFDDTTPFYSPPPAPRAPQQYPPTMPEPPMMPSGGGGGAAPAPEMPPAPAPAPSMQALGARDNPSQILERPTPGVNPMMGMRTRPPSMRFLQARAY
ncbi:MAG: hypothetical protein ACREK4_02925 [Candidatus Rokuibacteriota bacterium]